ncbi:hypothetical protein ACP275_08G176000 [Erythranthe tilingii]
MAKTRSTLVLIIFALASAILATAVSGDAAAATTICNVRFSELAECIPAITGKTPAWPTRVCCSVICKADLHCFCKYKSEFEKFGVDPANALALPTKCGLELPRGCKNM